MSNDTQPETCEAVMEPRFEPTGNGTFRLVAISATQTRTGPHQWDQAAPRQVTLLEHISAHLIAEIIAGGSQTLADATYPIRN
jgi:hypothetical protein